MAIDPERRLRDMQDAEAQAIERLEVGKLDIGSRRWKPTITDACDLLKKDFPEPKWAVPGLIPEGVTLLAGKPKMGKSWMALGFGIATASGGKALGQIDVPQGECLYLALEDNERRLKKRLKKLLLDDPMPPGLHLATEWRRVDEGGPDDLCVWLAQHTDCRLVVIDTLQKIRASRGARDAYEADYKIGASLQKIAHTFNIAILVIHHLRKMDADDPMDQISGTTGLTGGVDGSLVLTRARGKADAVLYVTGRDIEDDTPLALSWDAITATWQTTGPASPQATTNDRQKIIDLLLGTVGMTAKQAAGRLDESYETVRGMMRRMENDQELVITGGNQKTGFVYSLPNIVNQLHQLNQLNAQAGEVGQVGQVGDGYIPPCQHCDGEGCDWCVK